jgi:hypothetical protein
MKDLTKIKRDLSEVTLFSIDVRLWGARSKLEVDDLDVDSTKLPPAALVSLGSKKIFDPTRLRKLAVWEERGHSACAKHGFPFLKPSIYAVPNPLATGVASELERCEAGFNEERDKLCNDFEVEAEAWYSKPEFRGFENLIRNALPTAEAVKGKCSFDWTPFRVAAAGEDDAADKLTGRLATQVSGFAAALYRDIADAATVVLKNSLTGKERKTQKVLSPLVKIRAKLLSFSFVDPTVRPMITFIDYAQGLIPKSGFIEGQNLINLIGLMHVLADPDKTIEVGQAIEGGMDVATVFDQNITGGTRPDHGVVTQPGNPFEAAYEQAAEAVKEPVRSIAAVAVSTPQEEQQSVVEQWVSTESPLSPITDPSLQTADQVVKSNLEITADSSPLHVMPVRIPPRVPRKLISVC